MIFKKRKEKKLVRIDIKGLIESVKLHILVLDSNYHQLFQSKKKTRELLGLEKKLNNLLKEQGNIHNNKKRDQKLKKQIMDQLVTLGSKQVESDSEATLDRDLQGFKNRMEKLGQDIDAYDKRILELPDEIDEINKELFIEGITICYNKMSEQRKEHEVLEREIAEMRIQLQNKIDRHQQLTEDVEGCYNTMHNIIGVDVVNLIDDYYGYGGSKLND